MSVIHVIVAVITFFWYIFCFVFICLVLWHGITIELGKENTKFHFKITLEPLKKYFGK